MDIDETMSNEIAFTPEDKKDETFKFDEVKEESASSDTNDSEDTDSTPSEDKADGVTSEEEKRVPYSRFRTVKTELESTQNTIHELEERLAYLEQNRTESKEPEELEVPKEWVELYGDSDVSKRAYKIQLQREEKLQEEAVKRALAQFKDEAKSEEKAVEQNEEIIDDELETLQENLGKKLTPEIEEEILSIVDEFSPTGPDGKYVSLFPFDKAYEIYELRHLKANRKTSQARNQVAELTGNNSEGEIDSSDSNFKRGWDNWREAL